MFVTPKSIYTLQDIWYDTGYLVSNLLIPPNDRAPPCVPYGIFLHPDHHLHMLGGKCQMAEPIQLANATFEAVFVDTMSFIKQLLKPLLKMLRK